MAEDSGITARREAELCDEAGGIKMVFVFGGGLKGDDAVAIPPWNWLAEGLHETAQE